MLVLTRKYQEKIRIGDNITITVLRTKGKAVRLGIEAPPEVSVIRGELAFQQAKTNHEPAVAPVATSSMKPHGSPAPRVLAAGDWPADSPQRAAEEKRASSASTTVELKRVPRNKMAEVLPQLIGRSRPLRSIVDQ